MDPRAGRCRRAPPRKFLAGVRAGLIAFAEHEFKLGKRLKDGGTLRQHLEAARAQGADPAELHGPPCPPEAQYLWRLFCALHGKRSGGFGPGPIPSAEIEAWARLRGVRLTALELDWIDALDAVFLATSAGEEEP